MFVLVTLKDGCVGMEDFELNHTALEKTTAFEPESSREEFKAAVKALCDISHTKCVLDVRYLPIRKSTDGIIKEIDGDQ